jgi:hypothetical protein
MLPRSVHRLQVKRAKGPICLQPNDDNLRHRRCFGSTPSEAEANMQVRKLRMGWDVGGWHCDRNKNSRDALVLFEAVGEGLEALGWWRGNLREVLVTFTGAQLVWEMITLCGLRKNGPSDLTIAIDTPLGWPEAMLRLAHGGEPTSVPQDDNRNPYTRRATELDLAQRGYRPLSTVRDMLGSQSTKGLHFLRAARLQLATCGVWTSRQEDLSVTAIETYPAVAREDSLVSVHCTEMLTWPLFANSGSLPNDVEDALICALVAHLFSDIRSAVEPIPPNAPKLEGWIILPRNNGSADWSATKSPRIEK